MRGRAKWASMVAAVVSVVGCVQETPVDTGQRGAVETAPVVAPAGGPEPATTSTTEALPDPGAEPGVVVWVHDREPPDLHFDDPVNGTDLAGWVQQGLLEGLFGVDSNLAYYPELLAGEPELTRQDDGDVVVGYTLRSGLTWSDGTALTADDVAYTNRIIQEGCETEFDGSIVDATNDGCEYLMSSRIGYELVTDFEVTSPTEFTVSFSAFFAGWRGLYSQVMAEHAFGSDAFTVNSNLRRWSSDEGLLPSSGPLLFDRWEPGNHLDLVRNGAYHGSASPEAVNTGVIGAEGVRLIFVGDAESRIELLQRGAAHMLTAPTEPALAGLAVDGGVVVASRPGGVFEHLGLNLLNPHLARPEVREAVALALDKAEIVARVYTPILGPGLLPEAGAGNTYWMPTQAGYRDNQAPYAGNNVAAAAAKLEEAGYVGDPAGGWTHPETGRLRLRAGTTPGNELRQQQLVVIREQLARAGIEVENQSFPGGLFFDQGPFSPEAMVASASGGRSGAPDLWDMAVWSWATGPWPGGISGVFKQESDSNPYGFNNPGFDAAAAECEAIVDDGERAGCYNDADRFVTTLDNGDDGLFVIPLTQRPRYFAYNPEKLSSVGIAPDLAVGGPLVNAGDLVPRS